MTGDDLADLEIVTAASLRRWGLADAEAVAAHLVADLRRQLAGNTLYIDQGFHARNETIRAQFSGCNTAKLAAQYGLSERHIKRIISK